MLTRVEQIEAEFARLKEVEGRDGFTLDAYGREVVRHSGFAVALYEGPLYELTLHVIANGGYIGFWRDPKDGKEYTELVRIVENIREAQQLARQFNQKAFYNFATKEPVYV